MPKVPVTTFGEKALKAHEAKMAWARTAPPQNGMTLEQWDAARVEFLKTEEAAIASLKGAIKSRTEDPEWHVEVTHVEGLDALRARDAVTELSVRKRVRLAALDAGVDISAPGALDEFRRADVAYAEERRAVVLAWLQAGVVGGDAEIKRLHALGGDVLLAQAAEEVKAFQSISAALGEG